MSRIEKARRGLRSAYQQLESIERGDVVRLVDDLHPRLIPYLEKAGERNPVHHTAYVMEFLTRILTGEGRTEPFAVRVSMLAALFHDAGLGLSEASKITERHIRDKARALLTGRATLEELEAYLAAAVLARQEHMRLGGALAEEMLGEQRRSQAGEGMLNEETIREVKRIVTHHDDPKIPVIHLVLKDELEHAPAYREWRSALDSRERTRLDRLLDKDVDAYLIGVDDWLLQYHHEADLLWMVTGDGIEADIERLGPGNATTPREILENNVALHRDEVGLYRHLSNFSRYGFINGTVYRSRTGYALFEDLRRALGVTL